MPAARRGAATRTQQSSLGYLVAFAGVLAAVAAGYFRFPGVAALWVALLIAAWMEPPAIMTGAKDSAGFPTPAHPGEERNLRRFRFWRFCKFRLVLPNTSWLPGWPVLGAFVAALVAGAAAWSLPVSTVLPYSRWINAVAAFIIVATLTAARRGTAPEGPGCPGTRFNSIGALLSATKGRVFLVAGLLAAAVAGWAVVTHVPTSGPWAPGNHLLALGSTAALALTLVLAKPWQSVALARWRMLQRWSGIWGDRWKGIKIDPAPVLTDHREVGSATVDEFTAPSSSGAQAFWPIAPKISPSLGAGVRVAVLEMPDTDRTGQPQPGTRHPLRFQVVTWPSEDLPDLTDPEVDQDVVELFARCALTWTTDAAGYGRAVLISAEKISATPVIEPAEIPASAESDDEEDDEADPEIDGETGEPDTAKPARTKKLSLRKSNREGGAATAPVPQKSPAAWSSQWAFPGGPSLTEIRPLTDKLTGDFGAQVLIDQRGGYLYFGALTDPETVFTDGDAAATVMANLAREDKWTQIWTQVLKQGSNPPSIQHGALSTVEMAVRGRAPVTITKAGFVTRMGIDPAEYRGLEGKLATALSAAPFASVTGWPAAGELQGSRHPQAFGVVYSDGPVPTSPAELMEGPAANLILAGRINAAFDSARLARPEVAAWRNLTTRTSRGQIWELVIHLYGGVTLSDVRGAASRIQRELGVPWMRIAPDELGCSIFAGVKPESATLTRPSRDAKRLLTLDWNQAFIDAKTSGNNGLLPDLTATGTLPKNAKVQVLDFALPPGLDVAGCKAAVSKLKVATGNDFIEVRAGQSGASSLRLLVAEVNPLPSRVGFDFGAADTAQGWAFATGIEGEPVVFSPAESPHLLAAGVTGSGKSVLAQALLYGAAISGADLYVIDPVKGGADFQFVKPYSRAFASTPFEAAAVMKAVYAQVVERKNANAAAGVGSYLDLPDPPPPIVVMIDEFTSLMGQSPVPKTTGDDPEAEADKEALIADNAARATIGMITGKLAREARSAGVSLVLGTQKLSMKVLETIPGASDLKVNLARILLGKASWGDRSSALRAPDDAPVLEGDIPQGRGLWEPLTSSAMVIQAWYAPQSELASELATRRRPLEEDEALDLTPFMPKAVDPSQAAGSIIGKGPTPLPTSLAVQEPDDGEISDLGEISFDLSDLDAFLDDDDEATPDPQPAENAPTPEAPAPRWSGQEAPAPIWSGPDPVHTDAAIFLDVDGVLGPIGASDMTAGGWDGWRYIDGSQAGSTMASPQMLAALSELAVPMAWLTSWTHEAPDAFAGLLPPDMPVLHRGSEKMGWWKMDALAAYLDSHPEITRLVWADDQLSDEDPALGVSFAEITADLLDGRAIEHLLLACTPEIGLSRADLDRIEQFLHDRVASPEHADAGTTNLAMAIDDAGTHTINGSDAGQDDDDNPFAATPKPTKRSAPMGTRKVAAGRAAEPDPFDSPVVTAAKSVRRAVPVAEADPFDRATEARPVTATATRPSAPDADPFA